MRYVSATSICLAALLATQSSAWAWGALVVGDPPDVSKQGFSFGIDANSPTEDAARDAAMSRCKYTNVPNTTYVGNVANPSKAAQALCTLVTTFRGKCAVVADDPASGTPGVGWAVAPTLEDATAQAVNNCMATAGESRKQYCARQLYACDTT